MSMVTSRRDGKAGFYYQLFRYQDLLWETALNFPRSGYSISKRGGTIVEFYRNSGFF